MGIKNSGVKVLAAGLLLGLAGSALASATYWTDWTTATPGVLGTVSGTIALPGGQSVDVMYAGDYAFAVLDDSGVNYWAPESTYADGVIVGNGPVLKDIIALNGGGVQVHTLTFSQPVVNPVMAIVSLGQNGLPVTYDFDTSFDVVATGPGAFGNGPLVKLPNKILEGEEGHGTIQFQGALTAIHWTIPTGEYWHGFTVGLCEVGGPVVPAPGALLLLGIGTGLVGYLRRRNAL